MSARWRSRATGSSGACCVIRLGIHPCVGAIDPQLGEIPHRGLDRRPQLFLIGVQLQSGVHRGDPRIGHRRAVLGVHSHVAHVLVKPRTVLGIDRGRAGDGERRDTGDGKLLHLDLL